MEGIKGTLTIQLLDGFWGRLKKAYRLLFFKKIEIEFLFDEMANALLSARDAAIKKRVGKN